MNYFIITNVKKNFRVIQYHTYHTIRSKSSFKLSQNKIQQYKSLYFFLLYSFLIKKNNFCPIFISYFPNYNVTSKNNRKITFQRSILSS